MQKLLIPIFALILWLPAISQEWPVNKETKRFEFTEVVTVDSASKLDLYLRAKEWLAQYYNSSKDVIQVDEKEQGMIYGRGAFQIYIQQLGAVNFGHVNYDIKIDVKDGRYKYRITNFVHDNTYAKNGIACGGILENEKPACGWQMFTKDWNSLKAQSYNKTLSVIKSLKTFMAETSKKSNETW